MESGGYRASTPSGTYAYMKSETYLLHRLRCPTDARVVEE
jgi:hypothetical protein